MKRELNNCLKDLKQDDFVKLSYFNLFEVCRHAVVMHSKF